ncbi:MAG: ABC transporter substrate-binding protein [Chloroflexota bacterium]
MQSARFGQALGALTAVGSLLLTACQSQTAAAPTAVPTLSPQQVANLTPAQAAYQQARIEFDTVIVPAAKKEGEMNWYNCRQADEGEPMVKLFNQYYPDITINNIYGPGNAHVEKIAAEAAAGKIQADSYLCGGTSARNLAGRGLADTFTPPSALDPSVEYHFPIVQSQTKLTVWHATTTGLGINTNLVPRDKFPKTWWDLVRDPFWVDLFNRNLVAMYDPRVTGGHGHLIAFGLRIVNQAEYGDEWIRLLASYKPKIVNVATMDPVLRGEFHAIVGVGQTFKNVQNQDPVTTHCPLPGCTITQTIPVTVKGGPHTNAARVWAEFWLTKPAQDFLAKNGEAVARKDAEIHPAVDPATHPSMFWPDDQLEQGTRDNIKWITESKLFDY